MKKVLAAGAIILASGSAYAGEVGDRLAESLYSGTLSDLTEEASSACEAGESDACFALGLAGIIDTYETFAQSLYRHGAVAPNAGALGMFIGMGGEPSAGPANPDPEPLSYQQLRAMLDGFVSGLDAAGAVMLKAGDGASFVAPIDPLKVRIDLDGDGERGETETLGSLLQGLGEFSDIPGPDAPSSKSKSKGVETPQDFTIGFDNADAIWFAGYSNITATPVDMLLAHDFTEFFDTYMHRIFPKAGLPMGEHLRGGSVMMDPETDAYFADLIAGIHTARFPVVDSARLAGIIERLETVTARSRRNWELILAETDDDRELLPSPRQTSLFSDWRVTDEVVAAWLAGLDQVDRIIAGELLLPHWRFARGINLRTYFETATETDLVLLFTGHAAWSYLDDGPVADADDFAEINRVMGDEWPLFALWFN